VFYIFKIGYINYKDPGRWSYQKEEKMVYVNKFVVAVKSNGRIVRDSNGIVRLPFGSDYSLLLKNKNSVKALVNVEIDGENVLDGNSILVSPNQSTILKGFMDGRRVRNRFRFIRKTRQISKYRGDKIDDGLIRVEFRFEKIKPAIIVTPYVPYIKYYGNYSTNTTANICCSSSDSGITTRGAEINQVFNYGHIGELEPDSSVIVLKLVGKTKSGKIHKVVASKSKITCSICGKKSKHYAKFCSRCGTYIKS